MLRLQFISHKLYSDVQRLVMTLVQKRTSLDRDSIDFGDKPECTQTPPADKVPLLLVDGTILF